ncbi:MAG: PD-(D/E)XK nuclease family transposase [Thiolinea sp.]
MHAVASLRYGVIFKKAFSQPDIFTAFVKDILGIELIIDRVETEKSFTNPVGAVNNHFDLFAEDKINRIIVDIQHRRYPDHYHRCLHYHCAALLEQAVQSRDYRPALAVYTIVVLTSGDQYARDMLMIDFDPKDRHGLGMGEIPHKIIYLCPKYLNEETPEALREWMQAINDSLDGEVDSATYHNEKVQKVLEIIRKDTVTPEERARMKDEYSEEALLKEEREKGLRQGEQQKALDIAAQLLDLLDDATIAQKTGLSIAAVVSLRQG